MILMLRTGAVRLTYSSTKASYFQVVSLKEYKSSHFNAFSRRRVTVRIRIPETCMGNTYLPVNLCQILIKNNSLPPPSKLESV